MNPTFLDFRTQWSSHHGGASTRGIVGFWLRISYAIASACSTLRIKPNVITFCGVIAAGATAIYSPHWWSALFLALSLLCDGIDGSVAIIDKHISKMGAILDALADRLSDAFWAIAFYRLGTPLVWVLAMWGFTVFQEYARARLSALGVFEVGVITPAERPVRASFLLVAIVAWHLSFSRGWTTPLAACLTFLQAISFFLVLRFAHKELK